ncbi:MAG: DUF3888 domain-containing protein [Clostridium sp.]|uniref:DUF3888 domain-containing protein n=1 Tax=Clostridium sp. TaxID=1506 RepID=UPI002FC6EF7F
MKRSIALKTFIIVLVINLFFLNTTTLAHVNKMKVHYYNKGNSTIDPKEEYYKELFITLLAPYIDKAVEKYYGKRYAFAPWEVDVLSVDRPNNPALGSFIVKLQVTPYVGAHNSIGLDNITIKISYGEEPLVQKFEHIKSY